MMLLAISKKFQKRQHDGLEVRDWHNDPLHNLFALNSVYYVDFDLLAACRVVKAFPE
jgi:hypothetical protein